MNDRERFIATMHYQPRDRAPLYDFGFWPETIDLWKSQGLPAQITGGHDTKDTNAFFGMDALHDGPIANVGLQPGFEHKVIEDRGDHEVVQQYDGVRVLRRKSMSSIPTHEGHLLVDRASWNEHYKWRLDPNHPDRLPADWDAAVKIWKDSTRNHCCGLWAGSLYGWIRNWMGVEEVSYVVYDDPAFFEEMVETISDCIYHTLEKVLNSGGTFDHMAFWEDMCYNAGPLLAPDHFKKYLVPHYQRITGLGRKHGVDVVWVDCDGCIDHLIPLWLEGGVNCMFPCEVGTWNGDPVRYRKEYGKDLLLMGGFNKTILARSKQEITDEIKRLAPLMEEGGFAAFCDHRVPPDVPLENYMHYLHTAREIWCHGINLKPMGTLDSVTTP